MDRQTRNQNTHSKNDFIQPSPKRTSQRISFRSIMNQKSRNDSVADSQVPPQFVQSYMLRQRQPSNGPTSSHYSSNLGLFSKSFRELYTLDHLKHSYGLKESQWGASTQGNKGNKNNMPGSSHQSKRVTFEPDFSQVKREQGPSGFPNLPSIEGVPGFGAPQEEEFDRPTAIANSQSPAIMGAIGKEEPWRNLVRPQKSFNVKLLRQKNPKESQKGLHRLHSIQRLDPKSPLLIPQPQQEQLEAGALLTPSSVFNAEKNSGIKGPQPMLHQKRLSVKTEQQKSDSLNDIGTFSLRQKSSILDVPSECSRSMSSQSNSVSVTPKATPTKQERRKSDLHKSQGSLARTSDSRQKRQTKCTIRIFQKDTEALGQWGVEVSPHVSGNNNSKKRERTQKTAAVEPLQSEIKKQDKKLKKQSTMQMLAVSQQPTFQKPSFFGGGQPKMSSSSRSIQNSATFNHSQRRHTIEDSVSSQHIIDASKRRHSTRKSTAQSKMPQFALDPDVYEKSSESSQSINSEQSLKKEKILRAKVGSKRPLKLAQPESSSSSELHKESGELNLKTVPPTSTKKRSTKLSAKEAPRQSDRRRTPTKQFDAGQVEIKKKTRGRKPKREILDEDLEVQGETELSCSCTNTACLKKYCKCFDNQGYCSSSCKCTGCKNTDANAQLVKTARKKIMKRNPYAFKPKVKQTQARKSKGASARSSKMMGEPPSPVPDKVMVQNITSTHIQGCRCSKTQCLKNYCDCFLNGLLCNPKKCQCVCCKNTKKEVEKRMMQDDFLREFKDWIN